MHLKATTQFRVVFIIVNIFLIYVSSTWAQPDFNPADSSFDRGADFATESTQQQPSSVPRERKLVKRTVKRTVSRTVPVPPQDPAVESGRSPDALAPNLSPQHERMFTTKILNERPLTEGEISDLISEGVLNTADTQPGETITESTPLNVDPSLDGPRTMVVTETILETVLVPEEIDKEVQYVAVDSAPKEKVLNNSNTLQYRYTRQNNSLGSGTDLDKHRVEEVLALKLPSGHDLKTSVRYENTSGYHTDTDTYLLNLDLGKKNVFANDFGSLSLSGGYSETDLKFGTDSERYSFASTLNYQFFGTFTDPDQEGWQIGYFIAPSFTNEFSWAEKADGTSTDIVKGFAQVGVALQFKPDKSLLFQPAVYVNQDLYADPGDDQHTSADFRFRIQKTFPRKATYEATCSLDIGYMAFRSDYDQLYVQTGIKLSF